MQDEVANLLWEQSWQVFGESLSKVLSEAFTSYKRSAGYDEMQRLYPSAVGDEAFQVLRQALIQQWPKVNGESSHAYVELRGRLKGHVEQYLLRRLVLGNQVAPALRDALFAADLGV
ncbi:MULTISPECIES: hypothetical protein [Pseudomonas]|uniref:hypothetical protein n=1 Tax=Pseudomonas TaxID=286 RepID=UPI001647EF56|nr:MULTISPECIES: hypothetical protein [Pseudomonas]QXI20093.1 hypothetical protein HU724_013630 [Pseudomonas iranensis]